MQEETGLLFWIDAVYSLYTQTINGKLQPQTTEQTDQPGLTLKNKVLTNQVTEKVNTKRHGLQCE